MTTDEILVLLADERDRQRDKWNTVHVWGYGDCSSEPGMLGPAVADLREHKADAARLQYSNLIKAAVLAEEAGEVVKAALDVDSEQFRAEVIQTLAVAWAILEGIPE